MVDGNIIFPREQSAQLWRFREWTRRSKKPGGWED